MPLRSRRTAGLFAGLTFMACQAATAAPPPAENRAPGEARDNRAWWPNQVDLSPLRQDARSNPYGADFDYAKEFAKLDLKAVKKDIAAVLTKSQPWWPADYGNYGPFFIRMAWHSAGTYRVLDGRGGAGGGQQRFEPLNSWPDNGNLDKARRLVWPVKQKYGRALSWADLMVLAGNVAMEEMGFKTIGFAGGRADDWEADNTYWGPEAKMLADQRHDAKGNLKGPLAASQMGLIYVNPEGPGGKPDPKLAAREIRRTFGLMAMNDEETVALIAGGHSFGKAHGAHKPADCVGKEPSANGVETQGMGWHNKCGKGHSEDTTTSGLEGAWTSTPAKWSHQYFGNLMGFKWQKTKSPAGATQWEPTDKNAKTMVPDAHVAKKRHAPMMLTTDLALREDPAYAKISKRFTDKPEEFEKAFAKAWFKLTHRDLGPRARYIGAEVPKEIFAWQDPLPAPTFPMVTAAQAKAIKAEIMKAGIEPAALVRAAWSSAASFRGTDMRGGANGARVRLAPQNGWAANSPAELKGVLAKLETVKKNFSKGGNNVSMADVIVLGGAAAIEAAAKKAGHDIEVPFAAGRSDATAAQTDVKSFAFLEPRADGFRNYYSDKALRSPSAALIDRASMLNLTAPEMTALIGGLRVLDANVGGSKAGVLTKTPGALNNAFFRNLLNGATQWTPAGKNQFKAGEWTATEVDLVFGSNAELRAIAEVYASEEQKFLQDFVAAWVKVMQNDRFDLRR